MMDAIVKSLRMSNERRRMTDLHIDPNITDPNLKEEDPDEAHIVGPLYTDTGKISGATRITEAIFEGTPIEALCGYIWIPSKDPFPLPLCKACEALKNSGDRHSKD